MLIHNIKDFDGVDLFRCDKNKNQQLLELGFTPVYFDDDFYYYIIDENLQNYIDK